MKKSTKLLSVILAIVMLFSSLGVTSFAASLFAGKVAADTEMYDGNDKAQAYLLTDEQRAASFLDFLDGILGPLNITTYLDLSVLGSVTVDLRSADGLIETLRQVSKISLLSLAGELSKLELKAINGTAGTQTRAKLGDVGMCNLIITVLNDNGEMIGSVMDGLDLGVANSALPGNIKAILNDIPGLIKGMLYDMGVRTLSSLGEDPLYPNEKNWASTATKPTLDAIVKDLIVDLLTEPMWEKHITLKSQNTFSNDPVNEAVLREEIAKDANGAPLLDDNGLQYKYYYVYVNNSGTPARKDALSDEAAELAKYTKKYITHFDESSILFKDFDSSIVNLKTTTPYQILDMAIPLIFDKFAVNALNTDLRATLLRFVGAKFTTVTKTDANGAFTAEHTAVYNQVKSFLDMTDADFNNAVKTNPNLTGTQRHFYVKLGDKNYNVVSASAVQSKVEIYSYTMDPATTSAFADIVNWDYQIGTWAELTEGTGYAKGTSVLRNASDIIGKIINAAVPANASKGWNGWAYDTTTEDNAHFEANVLSLIRYALKTDPGMILGAGSVLPSDFDSYSDERVVVYVGADVMNWLMPTILLPKDVTTIEELFVYGLREFMTEIYPEYGKAWDDQIATAKNAASKDDAFLDIGLNMAMSTATYYLKNFLGYGSTRGNGGGVTFDVGPTVSWKEMLCDIIDWALSSYLHGLSAEIKKANPTVFVETNNNPFERISVIINACFPHAFSLVSNCGDSVTYKFNFETLFNNFRELLNLKVVPLVSCVYRSSGAAGTAIGNTGLAQDIVWLLLDFVAGLGFNKTAPGAGNNDWNGLYSVFSSALNNANPLDTLISQASLKSLVSNLIWVLADWQSLWLQNLATFITMINGSVWEMSYKGASQTTDKMNYSGASKVPVQVNFFLDAKGVAQAVYKGGFKTGEFEKYNAYSATLKRIEVVDLKGTVIKSQNVSAKVDANTVKTVQVDLDAPVAATPYRVSSYYTVTLPDGTMLDDGKEFKESTTITATSANTAKQKTSLERGWYNDSVSTSIDKVVYVDETQTFDQLGNGFLTVTGAANKYLNSSRNGEIKFSNLGTIKLNADGSKYILEGYNATVGKMLITNGQGVQTQRALNDPANDFFPKAVIDVNGMDLGSDVSFTGQYWVANPSASRSQYTDDFYSIQMKFDKTQICTNKQITSWGSAKWEGDKFNMSDDVAEGFNQVLMMYNSYGLNGLVSEVLFGGIQAADYTKASWDAYMDTINAATALCYGAWNYATFMADNTVDVNGVKTSRFKVCADNIKAAKENLVLVAETTGGHTEAELAKINSIVDYVKTGSKAVAGDYKDYALYTYLRFANALSDVSWRGDSVKAPSGVANNTLAGVNLNTADLTALVNALPAGKQKDIISKMVKAPTAEAAAKAAKEKADWEKNPVRTDIGILQAKALDAKNYTNTVVAKYSAAELNDTARTGVKYYLQSAVNFINADATVKDGKTFTAESVARLQKQIDNANTLLAKADAKHSELHAARYGVIVAYRGLVGTADQADFAALESAIATAEQLLTTVTVGATLDPNVENLMATLGYKATLNNSTYWVGGETSAKAVLESKGLTANDEFIAGTTKNLTDAIAKLFALAPSNPGSSTGDSKVDNTDRIVDGVNPAELLKSGDLQKLVEFAGLPAGVTATIVEDHSANSGRVGTGSKVDIKVGNTVVTSYTLVIYGDVNGDGNIDALDAFASNKFLSHAKTEFNGAYGTAADVNKDGKIDGADYTIIMNALKGTAVDQKKA